MTETLENCPIVFLLEVFYSRAALRAHVRIHSLSTIRETHSN